MLPGSFAALRPLFLHCSPTASAARDRVWNRRLPKRAIRQTSDRALGGKIRWRSCSWRREQMETATRAACEKLESHRPRSRGSSKDKTSDARRIPPAQDKAPTNHPIVLALNPSSKVAACLVAPTRIARPEVRIYTRRVAPRRSGATVCAPVGRLSKQSREQSLENLLPPGSPSARTGTRSHYFFRAERRSERGAGSNVCSPAVEPGQAIGERRVASAG